MAVRLTATSLQAGRTSDRAVDGGAGDAEQLGELGGGVFSCAMESDEVRFVPGAEFGLLAAESAFALARAMPSRVRIR
jgi:hypothetical protein